MRWKLSLAYTANIWQYESVQRKPTASNKLAHVLDLITSGRYIGMSPKPQPRIGLVRKDV